MTRPTGRFGRGIGALLVVVLLGGCAEATRAPGRVYGALLDYFDRHAEQMSPVAEQVPETVRGHKAERNASRHPAPVRIMIPSIDVDSRLDRLGLTADGTVEAPPEWDTPGWYRKGARPGQRGAAVILGHVDSTTGPAVFYRLDELEAGDRITVERKDGSRVHFAVTHADQYQKAQFPSADVYLPTPDATLRLVTCGGEFDRATGSYLENLVVFADLVA